MLNKCWPKWMGESLSLRKITFSERNIFFRNTKKVLSRRQSIKRERENTRIPLLSKLTSQPQSQPIFLSKLDWRLLYCTKDTELETVQCTFSPLKFQVLKWSHHGSKPPLCESCRHLPWLGGGGGLGCHQRFFSIFLLNNHLLSLPDCQNAFCTYFEL